MSNKPSESIATKGNKEEKYEILNRIRIKRKETHEDTDIGAVMKVIQSDLMQNSKVLSIKVPIEERSSQKKLTVRTLINLIYISLLRMLLRSR
jgi:hypothetical protein